MNTIFGNQKKILLKNLCDSDILTDKQPRIIENDTAIVCQNTLSIRELSYIEGCAEEFNLKVELHYDGTHTKVIFK